MITKELNPKLALNKAFLKIKPNRSEIELFKSNLIILLDKLKTVEDRPKDESEEHLKNDIRDFLRDTFYKDTNTINTKDKKDLVIHTSKDTNSNVGVIIEAKRPSNKGEMLSKYNLNKKALQELVLYYLRERITHKNLEIKHLIITNINEWYIFDEHLFERLFNKKDLVNKFESFEHGKKSTSVFYKEIAEPFIQSITNEIEYTYFNLKDYESALRNQDKKDDKQLIELFKLLSPPHLLKLPFNNDSNSLDKNFYGELLHIIGLVEVKEGGKKLIQRPKDENKRNPGSLLENTINQLDSLDKISRLTNPKQYGETQEERLFNVGLELCITWVNRILFLKLLEAQLISYHKGDKSYSFLNKNLIHDYDNLNSLFFMVLARKPEDRNERVKDLFSKVPYLNSSLFEPTVLEHEALFISGLEDNIHLPFLSSTVNKDNHGNKEKGSREGLAYLFDFLSSYNFTSDSSVDIQEDNKTLINASVLGLIFEKINGYKDGSFFTPGFITEYMCRETIRKSVIQKFNEVKSWNCIDFNHLYNKIDDINEANKIINEIKICDPAVGSGHFLVSALNEMLSVKNDLGILQDKDGKRLKGYHVEVINDELVVTDENGDLYEYNPLNKESQRIQETLFHEKQTIIENCLFGVDINPNSVKICRLRLWIELLKNAYYKTPNELETLPNIDINIKCGNSLVSRFAVDSDMKEIMKKSKWSIDEYKRAVDTYRNAESKDQKREMEKLINDIKSDFRSEISLNDPKVKKLRKLSGDLYQMTNQGQLFEMSKKEKADWNAKVKELTEETKKLEAEIEEIKANKIFENAFEWRFEFPEVLNDDGDFVGFDVVIGNPPYIDSRENEDIQKEYWKTNYKSTEFGKTNTYEIFIEKGIEILNNDHILTYIFPIVWLSVEACQSSRRYVLSNFTASEIAYTEAAVFVDANVDTMVLQITKRKPEFEQKIQVKKFNSVFSNIDEFKNVVQLNESDKFKRVYLKLDAIYEKILRTISGNCSKLSDLVDVVNGIATGPNKEKYFASTKLNENYKPLLMGGNIQYYKTEFENVWINYDRKLLHRAREESIFLADEKIIMQRIRNVKLERRIVATLDTEQYYTFNSVNNLLRKNKEYNLRYVLGVLNSKLVNYLIKNLSSNTNLTAQDLDEIPFRNINFDINLEKDIYEKIITKVDEILCSKKNNNETSNLEGEIDQLVYQLYDLTEEEIEIIEGL